MGRDDGSRFVGEQDGTQGLFISAGPDGSLELEATSGFPWDHAGNDV